MQVGCVELGSISGIKFEDLDGDGAFDSGEPGLAAWRLFLDLNLNDRWDEGEPMSLTDASGQFRVDGLLPGAYRLAEMQQDVWVQSLPDPASPGGVAGLSLSDSRVGMISLSCRCGGVLCPGGSGIKEPGTRAITAALAATKVTAARLDPRFAHLTGPGVRTVVIDTGIDLDHPFFGPGADGNRVADRILYAYDFAHHDADATDFYGHGSHVASLIASQEAKFTGVAPETDLIVPKVFEDSGKGHFSYLEEALQWVIAHQEAYRIGVVNLSLGDGGLWRDAFSRYGLGG